jgi:hypothetical protein
MSLNISQTRTPKVLTGTYIGAVSVEGKGLQPLYKVPSSEANLQTQLGSSLWAVFFFFFI